MEGASNTILCQKFARTKLDAFTRDPEDSISKL